MTKEEAIKAIEAAPEESGFCVMSMDKDDVEAYCLPSEQERYSQLTSEQKKKWLGLMMDKVNEMLELGEDYGFRKMLSQAIDGDDWMDELFEQAKK